MQVRRFRFVVEMDAATTPAKDRFNHPDGFETWFQRVMTGPLQYYRPQIKFVEEFVDERKEL